MKKVLSKSLIMNAAFLAFTLFIYAPLELFLSNCDEFWFSLSDFVGFCIIIAIVVLIFITIIGHILSGHFSHIFEALIFGLGLCIYLQGNFMNLDIGVMNGADVEWSQYIINFIFNAIIWIFIVLCSIIIAYKYISHFRKVSFYISTLFILTQLVSLCALLFPYISSDSSGQKTSAFVSDQGLYELGSEDNVVVFILDMYDDNYFKEILKMDPAIKGQLDGFTYFSNFSGSYSTTVYSIAHLATGKYFYNEESRGDWVNNIASNGIYLDELINNNYQLNIYTGLPHLFPNRIMSKVENYDYAPLKINNRPQFMLSLYQLVMCKYFPNAIKPKIWMTGNEFSAQKAYDSQYNPYLGDSDNSLFLTNLRQNGLSVQGTPKQYKFIHLMGTHYPYDIDENANPVDPNNNSVSDVQCAQGVLKMVCTYLDYMKSIGCYDNTAVIITADHGYYWDGVLSNPVFIVKPKNAHGNLLINNAPTCQGDFAATVLDLADIEASASYGKSAFDVTEGDQRERFFYQYFLKETPEDGNYRLIQYKVDNQTNCIDKFQLTDIEYTPHGDIISHSQYCQTCQQHIQPDTDHNPPRLYHEKSDDYPE